MALRRSATTIFTRLGTAAARRNVHTDTKERPIKTRAECLDRIRTVIARHYGDAPSRFRAQNKVESLIGEIELLSSAEGYMQGYKDAKNPNIQVTDVDVVVTTTQQRPGP